MFKSKAPGLTHKHYIGWNGIARNKQSSLIWTFVSYDHKKFLLLWALTYKCEKVVELFYYFFNVISLFYRLYFSNIYSIFNLTFFSNRNK